jgi:hypothetical protein
MSQDYSKIDTSGTKISTNEDGTFDVTFDKKKVTERAFKEVMEYIYTDRVGYAKNSKLNFKIDGIRILINQ